MYVVCCVLYVVLCRVCVCRGYVRLYLCVVIVLPAWCCALLTRLQYSLTVLCCAAVRCRAGELCCAVLRCCAVLCCAAARVLCCGVVRCARSWVGTVCRLRRGSGVVLCCAVLCCAVLGSVVCCAARARLGAARAGQLCFGVAAMPRAAFRGGCCAVLCSALLCRAVRCAVCCAAEFCGDSACWVPCVVLVVCCMRQCLCALVCCVCARMCICRVSQPL